MIKITLLFGLESTLNETTSANGRTLLLLLRVYVGCQLERHEMSNRLFSF